MTLTFEDFERRARADAYVGFWSRNLVMDKALAEESATLLVLLMMCNHFGIVVPPPLNYSY